MGINIKPTNNIRMLSVNFKQWLIQDRENRRLFLLYSLLTLTVFSIFKSIYPYPNFTSPDSDAYLNAAFNNQLINNFAIGYSKFLRLFSSFFRSSLLLVFFQFGFLQSAILYFLFSLRYILTTGKWVFRVLLVFCIANPVILQVSNLISSESLYTTISLIWLTQLIWLKYNPTNHLVVSHAFVLLLGLALNYNFIYYLLISITVILFLNLKSTIKFKGLGLIVALSILFFVFTFSQYRNVTEVRFSPFGGWQLASNVLFAYAHAPLDSPTTLPVQLRQLHKTVNDHMASLRQVPFFLRPDHNVGSYYLVDERSPLRIYMNRYWSKDSSTVYVKRWATMSQLYADYGQILIKKHPWLYLKYYLLANLVKFYVPPTECLGMYNEGKDTISNHISDWFGWKSNKIYTRDKSGITLIQYFPMAMSFINLLYALSLITFIGLGLYNNAPIYLKWVLKLVMYVWVTNILFSIIISPVELRQQIFPMLLTFCFLSIQTEYILRAFKIKTFKVSAS